MRLPPLAAAPPARIPTPQLRLSTESYELTSQEVELDDGTATAAALNAYLTEETVQPGQPRADRAILLLPPATGWKHAPTRRLADRLAIICRCLVLLPDLLRGGAPFDAAAVNIDGGYAAWAAEQPPARLAADVRASAVYLRADHRVRGLGVVGVGRGAEIAVAHSGGLRAAAVVGVGPPRCDFDALGSAIDAPLMLLLDGTDADADAERARALLDVEAAAPPAVPEPDGDGDGLVFQVAGEEIKVGDLKVADLKARLAALGEPTSGKKAELVDRLTKAVAKSKKREQRPPPAPPTSRHMVVASARAAELAASLPDDQVCDLPPPCDEAESKEEEGEGEDEVPPYEESGADEDEDEAAREDLLMLVEGWANAHLHEWSG